MKPFVITADRLNELRACNEQLDIFKRHFGDSVEVTLAACIKYADQFDWNWATFRLLSKEAYKVFVALETEARRTCEVVVAPARRKYFNDGAPMREAYVKRLNKINLDNSLTGKAHMDAKQEAWDKLQEDLQPTLTTFDTTIHDAMQVYHVEVAMAFYRACCVHMGAVP
jgi:hypothetical protein